jgi:sucrose phosphorylase
VIPVRDGVQLIAYADRLGGSVAALTGLLDGPLAGLFSGVHVLPFYVPYDGADAGFDPVDHLRVDPRLGDWEDVRRLSRSVDVVADLVVNHVSDRSAAFQDVVAHGAHSPYAGMFLTYGAVFPRGATEADLLRIVRPRPGLPFTPVAFAGRPHLAWTTFTHHQIDLDVRHPAARRYLSEVLRSMAAGGVTTVRLDAIGYAVKTPGTTCFLTRETLDFVGDLVHEARGLGLRTLAEVHAHHMYAAAAARSVDLVYDFSLAPLILHAVFTGDGSPLRDWLGRRPVNCANVLETHDGIGLVDAGPGHDPATAGLLSPAQLEAVVAAIDSNSGGTSRVSRLGGVGPYQVSCTAYDAVGGDDRRYLLARLLQLFVPGIPQVYYVGLLAGRNDTAHVGPANDPREINRRSYTSRQVLEALGRPVVRELCRLIRLRGRHPAFRGQFRVDDSPTGGLVMTWRAEGATATLRADLTGASYKLEAVAGGTREIFAAPDR